MAEAKRCPECGAGDLQVTAPGRLRCAGCGADLAYRVARGPLLLTWALVGAAMGAVGLWLFKGVLGVESTMARVIVAGVLTGVISTLLSRRFRTLRKA